MKKAYLLILLTLLPLMGFAQDLSVAERNAQQGFNDTIDRLAPDFVTVSLVVADPDEVLYSTLGHAALHLQCPVFDLDYIFTYESEGIRNKILSFLRGNLKMGMFAMPPKEFLDCYRQSGRGVREYKLNLSPEQKQELWRVMDKHVAEGANLPYDYFRRGCAKSVVQVVHEAIGKDAIHYTPWSDKYTKQTQRELVRNFIKEAPWEEFFMYFLIGVEGDKACPCEQKLIVPTDLVEVWQQAFFDNGDPVLEKEAYILLEPTQTLKAGWCTPLLVCLFLCILSFFSLVTLWVHPISKWAGIVIDYTVLAVASLAGLVMTYLIVFSGLPCTNWNWLIIPFNILPIICWHWRKYWTLPYATVIFVWCGIMSAQHIWGHVLVDWPHIILALAFALVLIKQFILSFFPTAKA